MFNWFRLDFTMSVECKLALTRSGKFRFRYYTISAAVVYHLALAQLFIRCLILFQDQAIKDVQKVLVTLMKKEYRIVVVNNSTHCVPDAEVTYTVRLASVDDSKSIRLKFGSFFVGAPGKGRVPADLKGISIRNRMTSSRSASREPRGVRGRYPLPPPARPPTPTQKRTRAMKRTRPRPRRPAPTAPAQSPPSASPPRPSLPPVLPAGPRPLGPTSVGPQVLLALMLKSEGLDWSYFISSC